MTKVVSPKQAILTIPKGKRIFIGSGAATPNALVKALHQNSGAFSDNEVTHILTLGAADYCNEASQWNLRDNSLFIGHNVRKSVQLGYADYTPIFLSEIPRLFASGSFPIHTALVSVSPPDKHGMCSLGVSVDVVRAAIENAKVLIAQINPKMPRTFGRTFIPYDSFDYVVNEEEELPQIPGFESDPVIDAIAQNVASLISDGSTLQLGIGSIPDAILNYLDDKKELGIHTEMMSDGVIDLLKSGVITNEHKSILKNRSLTSFAMGTNKLYDYLNENPLIEFYPSNFVNDPFNIASNPKMICINSALQVDLTGQICADSLGPSFYSGIGGQVDFMRGAARSQGGKPIIALPSTAKGDTISRIVGQLDQGAGVVTSRGDAHYIVTEFGIAQLHGKSIRQRAMELIHIAHPNFREDLLKFVKSHHYVYFDQKHSSIDERKADTYTEHKVFKNENFIVRPLKVTDERRLQDFFYSHQIATLYHRYMGIPKKLDHNNAQTLVNVDYKDNMAFGIFKVGEYDDEIIAIGRLSPTQTKNRLELKIVVGEDFRHYGTGKYLSNKLINYAKDRGVKEIVSSFFSSNRPMKRIMEKLGKQFGSGQSIYNGDEISYVIQLTK
ncbi:MAG: GNAT family N-acetyltransferase [Candidatus Cloacimonetes bacterium]|nr:GNAT family N-acetyltransferase [Candidatus Cloacimonadota bacterium]